MQQRLLPILVRRALFKAGDIPRKASPRSWMIHMRMTLFISASGNSSCRKKAIKVIIQLCSATLSRLPLEV